MFVFIKYNVLSFFPTFLTHESILHFSYICISFSITLPLQKPAHLVQPTSAEYQIWGMLTVGWGYQLQVITKHWLVLWLMSRDFVMCSADRSGRTLEYGAFLQYFMLCSKSIQILPWDSFWSMIMLQCSMPSLRSPCTSMNLLAPGLRCPLPDCIF